jgi:hypothetical protein
VEAYVGLIDTIFSPFLEATHSLLMNKPVGCVYLRPLGAVSSTDKLDILSVKIVDMNGIEGRVEVFVCAILAELEDKVSKGARNLDMNAEDERGSSIGPNYMIAIAAERGWSVAHLAKRWPRPRSPPSCQSRQRIVLPLSS